MYLLEFKKNYPLTFKHLTLNIILHIFGDSCFNSVLKSRIIQRTSEIYIYGTFIELSHKKYRTYDGKSLLERGILSLFLVWKDKTFNLLLLF
jgi:hypothetical protein